MEIQVTDTVMTVTLPVEAVWCCEECYELTRLMKAGPPLYQCEDCGEVFNREQSEDGDHRCPGCNKFASKLANESCPHCETGVLTEEQAVVLNGGRVLEVDKAKERIQEALD